MFLLNQFVSKEIVLWDLIVVRHLFQIIIEASIGCLCSQITDFGICRKRSFQLIIFFPLWIEI